MGRRGGRKGKRKKARLALAAGRQLGGAHPASLSWALLLPDSSRACRDPGLSWTITARSQQMLLAPWKTLDRNAGKVQSGGALGSTPPQRPLPRSLSCKRSTHPTQSSGPSSITGHGVRCLAFATAPCLWKSAPCLVRPSPGGTLDPTAHCTVSACLASLGKGQGAAVTVSFLIFSLYWSPNLPLGRTLGRLASWEAM